MIKVAVSGAAGKMGIAVCQAVSNDDGLELVGAADPKAEGRNLSVVAAIESNVIVQSDLSEMLSLTKPDVLIDFTNPSVVMGNIEASLNNNVHIIVGTTGIAQKELDQIEGFLQNSKANVFIAANFAIGAILMMHAAKIISKHMPNYEIIELHHDQKVDSPSGTSIATAGKLEGLGSTSDFAESVAGARGASVAGTRVHSIRLPGLVAHQEVIFGAQGQTLTIKHDSIDRTCFMPGVVLAARQIASLNRLTVGLENLMDL